MAGRLGAAPSGLSFGDSAARAGARPIGYWCGCRESHPDMLPGEEPFWLLNYNRKVAIAAELRRRHSVMRIEDHH